MEWAGPFLILWEYGSKIDTEVIPIGSQKSRPFHIMGPSKEEI